MNYEVNSLSKKFTVKSGMLGDNKKQDKNEFVYKLVSKLADTPGRVTSSWVYFGSHFQRHRTSSR